jgi:hypothetical protein
MENPAVLEDSSPWSPTTSTSRPGIVAETVEETRQLVVHLPDARVVRIHQRDVDRRVEPHPPLPKCHQLRRRTVDRPGVGPHELRLVFRQREVVAVYVVVVDEEKPPLPRELLRPLERLIGDRARRLALCHALHDVAELLKAALEPEGLAEIVGVHDRSGRKAARRELAREGRDRIREFRIRRREPVAARIDTREERGMRRKRPWGGDVTSSNTTPLREGIETRRGRARVPVRTEMVRSQGVDRDEQDAGRGGAGRSLASDRRRREHPTISTRAIARDPAAIIRSVPPSARGLRRGRLSCAAAIATGEHPRHVADLALPVPTSTSVPTIARTMCFRNAVASIR